MTSRGGLLSSPLCLQDPSLPPSPFPTYMPSLMQVQASALPSLSVASGELGVSSPDGNRSTVSVTSVGQRHSDSNSSSGRSLGLEVLAGVLKSSGITKESLRVGGTSGAETNPLTSSSAGYIPSSSSSTTHSPSSQLMFPVASTQQTLLPEVSTPLPTSSYPRSHSLMVSTGSLLTRPTPTPQLRSVSFEKAGTPPLLPSALIAFSEIVVPVSSKPILHATRLSVPDPPPTQFNSRFSSDISSQLPSLPKTVVRYADNLSPAVSHLRPHCPARDRLRLWKPTFLRSTNQLNLEITEEDLDRLIMVINTSWQPATRETYGAGLLVFHVFCDLRLIPEDQRCPADPLLMLTFISACAGSYSGKTLGNYFYAVQAWHTLHGAPWRMNATEMKAALDGAAILAPPSSKRPKRSPLMIVTINSLAPKFDTSKPLDASVFSCLTTTFFAVARLGEFTVPTLKAFVPSQHVKPSDVRQVQDRHGLPVTVFGLPHTKTAKDGEDVFWSAQEGAADPFAALANHLAVNNPPARPTFIRLAAP